jgi:hypothetical protein
VNTGILQVGGYYIEVELFSEVKFLPGSSFMNHRFNLSDFKTVLKTVYMGIRKIVGEARGSCVSFTPRKVLEFGGVDTTAPVALTLVKHILEKLVEAGYMQRDDSRARIRYVLCKNSPLWQRLRGGDAEALALIEAAAGE